MVGGDNFSCLFTLYAHRVAWGINETVKESSQDFNRGNICYVRQYFVAIEMVRHSIFRFASSKCVYILDKEWVMTHHSRPK
jgi:hypothetical protein